MRKYLNIIAISAWLMVLAVLTPVSADSFLLNSTQVSRVAQDKLERNFTNCQYEITTCKVSLLTDGQKSAVLQAKLERNFSACQYELDNCDLSQLTTHQLLVVKQTVYERNFSNCRYELSSCKEQWLDHPERVTLQGEKIVDSSVPRIDFTPAIDSNTTKKTKREPYWDKAGNPFESVNTWEDTQHTDKPLDASSLYEPTPLYKPDPIVGSTSTSITPTSPTFSYRGTGSRYYDYNYRPPVGEYYVSGYTRKDGTYVAGHYRRSR